MLLLAEARQAKVTLEVPDHGASTCETASRPAESESGLTDYNLFLFILFVWQHDIVDAGSCKPVQTAQIPIQSTDMGTKLYFTVNRPFDAQAWFRSLRRPYLLAVSEYIRS